MERLQLTVEPKQNYLPVGPDNPLVARLTLQDEDSHSTLVLGEETLTAIVDLAQKEARRFVQSSLNRVSSQAGGASA